MELHELQEKIKDLDDSVALKLLNTVAEPHTKKGPDSLPDDQATALARDYSLSPNEADTGDGVLARQALLVLAGDSEHRSQIDQLIDTPDIRAFPSGTPMQELENQTLIFALKKAVSFDRDENGRVRAKTAEASVDEQVLREFAAGVLAKTPGGPLREE